MTRMYVVVVTLMTLISSMAFCASLPGQDIHARASVAYYVQSQVNASACIDFVDTLNAAAQSASQPSTAVIESSATPVTGGPATAFVAPDANTPLYATCTSSLYMGASLVGKQVKLAGRFSLVNGTAFLDDGGSVVGPDGSVVNGVALRTDLISSLPADGSFVTIQGVVRVESNGQLTLLPLADTSIARVQQ